MGVIFAKFRKGKSTLEVLEALQEKINTLETFTVDTQEQKKRIVGNFLAVSIGVYVLAFVVFYFIYFPPTWQERFVYFIPLLLFPIIIILLRYLFTWYFQRKLNKNSKKLTELRAEKKKILEQVMDKETYKVAVNYLARFADKPSRPTYAMSPTPSKVKQPMLNRSLPSTSFGQKSTQLALTPTARSANLTLGPNLVSTPSLITQLHTPKSTTPTTNTAMVVHPGIGGNQQLRRRTPFPIVNQQDKGVFDRIVDVLIGDGPQDRFAMICKECFSHNGMALKEDFEYTTFRCAFCNALNPARKARPVAPRLSVMPGTVVAGSDTSDSEEDKDDSDDERRVMNLVADTTQFSEFSTPSSNVIGNSETADAAPVFVSSSSDVGEENPELKNLPQIGNVLNKEATATSKLPSFKSLEDLLKERKKSDFAIEDTTMSPE